MLVLKKMTAQSGKLYFRQCQDGVYTTGPNGRPIFGNVNSKNGNIIVSEAQPREQSGTFANTVKKDPTK